MGFDALLKKKKKKKKKKRRMGFDALLKKKSFKTYKFKATVSLAISRLAVLKNQRQVRCSIARSDVIQLLNIGHHERALLRVEVVIKEQNMLDAFVMMEGYCDLLIERLHQIEQEKRTCPEELKEAASSLIYASTRCGEFPELQEIRAMLASHFGKDFVARAVELRNNCGVNTKMIQKLSTRMPALENRIKVLKDIASENNIVLLLDDVILETSVDKVKEAQPNAYTTKKYEDSKTEIFLQAATELEAVEGVTDKKRYKNVADAAQAAFESAAYAAAAARAAVELSRADSHDPSDNHHSPISPNLHSKENSSLQEPENSISNIEEEEKIHPVENDVSESDKEEEATKTVVEEFKQERNNESKAFMRSISTLSSEESDNEDLVKKLVEKEINFDGSEDEKTSKDDTMSPRIQDLGLESKQTVPGNYGPDNEKVGNKESDSIEARPYSPAHKFSLFGSRAGSKTDKSSDNNSGHCLTGMFRVPKDDLLSKDKVPISVRTRRTFRWGL